MTLLLYAALAAAADATVQGAWSDDNGNARQDDDRYGALVTRTTVSESTDVLSAQARFDSATFYEPPARSYKDALRLERLSVTLETAELRFTAGDFYRQLGRGFLLSLRKQDEVGLDLGLRGGEALWRGEALELAAFAGRTNAGNLDAVTHRALPDPNDAVAGAEATLRGDSGAALTAMAVYLEPRERLLDTIDRTVAGGLAFAWPDAAEWLALYAEADVQRRILAGVGRLGWAGYATLDVTLGATSLLFEGLWLDEFEMKGGTNRATRSRFRYDRPPTLQRIEEEVLGASSAIGGRIRAAHRLGELSLEANALYRVEEPRQLGAVTQLHGWAGFECPFASGAGRIALNAGYREERQRGGIIKILRHVNGDWVQPLGIGKAALHLSTLADLRSLAGAGRHVRGSSFAGVDAAPWSVTFELGYDTEQPGVRQLFYAGIVGWRLSDAIDLDATVGSQRGGLKCVSGVCRELPAFAGAKLELVAKL